MASLIDRIIKYLSPTKHHYFYVFIRQDLPLADQLCQSNHAAFAVSQLVPDFETIPHIVLIGVSNKEELESTINLLVSKDIKFAAFYEPDHDHGLTAIATAPIKDSKTREALSHYTLWKPNLTNLNL
jgi:hypothetical protein